MFAFMYRLDVVGNSLSTRALSCLDKSVAISVLRVLDWSAWHIATEKNGPWLVGWLVCDDAMTNVMTTEQNAFN